MRYGTGEWDCDTLGNHRAVVRVDGPAEAVRAHIDWRRRDLTPEKIDAIVVCAQTRQRIANVARVEINREFGG